MATVDRGEISARIKQAREEAGIRQREVADRFSVHENTVQLWENGQKNKRGQHVWSVPWDRLEDLYGVSATWLRTGEESVSVQAELRDLREEVAAVRALIEELVRQRAV
jgi:transcriptional regulator with XRE-family HTH domain